MRAEIEVLHPGLFSTLQDEGRLGYMNFGVPMSGPMDLYASRFGNLILNNSINAPLLEITQTGPTLKFGSSANIAITGGDLSPRINGSEIRNDKIYRIIRGDTLSFGRRMLGCRAYVSVQGGFLSEKILGSSSWYEGLTPHFRLIKGMKLYYDAGKQQDRLATSSVRSKRKYLSDEKIPVFEGPEFQLLPPELQSKLLGSTYSIDPSHNRMAIQLKEIFENNLLPVITSPVIPGIVQLTPSGKLIILMRDCQTTGGYPRVLQVNSEGMNKLAQKISGDKVNFSLLKPGQKEVPPV